MKSQKKTTINKEKIAYYIGLLFIGVGILLMLNPAYFWFHNPELTRMQVLIETWEFSVGGLVMIICGNAVLEFFWK